MPHFTTRFDFGFTIEVQRGVALGSKIGDSVHIVAYQVLHCDIRVALPITKGPARHCTNVLFKLVNCATVLGPVAGIMHPWRNLVDDQSSWRDE